MSADCGGLMACCGLSVLLMASDAGTIGNQRREAASALQSKRVERWGVSEQIRHSLSLSVFPTVFPPLALSPYRFAPPLSPPPPPSHPTPSLTRPLSRAFCLPPLCVPRGPEMERLCRAELTVN